MNRIFFGLIFLFVNASIANAQRPYSELIPASAIKYKTFLTLDQVDKKLYLELPAKWLSKDMLFVSGHVMYNQKTVRFDKLDDQIIFRISPSFVLNEITDSAYIAWATSGKQNKIPDVLAQLPIEALSPEGAYVVDVTQLFMQGYGLPYSPGESSDYSKAVIKSIAARPYDLSVETNEPKKYGTGNIDMVRQLVPLPEQKMKPRLFDSRVGFFGVCEKRSGVDIPKEGEVNINMIRWRMEKKEPAKKVSEPVRPIVIYIRNSIEAKWRPYVKKGIEDWLPAFEAAGFRNAIVVKDEPVNDPSFSLHDLRTSYVDMAPLEQSGDRSKGSGSAGQLIDEQTGEILKAVISVGVNSLRTLMYWYFTQCSPLDPRAWQYPMPDELAGELLRNFIAHETGHAFGLMDGNYGRFSYPVDSLRSATWLKKMSHTPSVMNYTRNNYVAQPGDKINPDDLRQRVGVADVFNIRIGYTPIPGAKTAQEELPVINKWLKIQETNPSYIFYRELSFPDVGPYTYEAMDDTDPVKSSKYALANVRRVMNLLSGNKLKIPDTLDYADLYNETLEQRSKSLDKVIDLIGGYTVRHKTPEASSIIFTAIPVIQQHVAMKYIDTAAFSTPLWVIKAPATVRFAPSSYKKFCEVQSNLVKRILSGGRLERLEKQEAEARKGQPVYTVDEVLKDIRKIIWKELDQNNSSIDTFRQVLQKAYLVRMKEIIYSETSLYGGKDPTSPRSLALCTSELEYLNKKLTDKLAKIHDQKTKDHINVCIGMIERIKNPVKSKKRK